MNKIIFKTISNQIIQQRQLENQKKKDNGVFFTNELKIIDSILDIIEFDKRIIDKKILEPAVGNGIFLLRIIEKVYNLYPFKEYIRNFIENNLYFVDIDKKMIDETKKNICNLYYNLFNKKYNGKFNSFVYDFTNKLKNNNCLFNETKNKELENLLDNVDYVIGNPPYITLYGRRDRKKNEEQRMNYLNQYEQFPKSVKNGKINYVMLFLEHGLDFLKKEGKLAYIIDISFFETAYKFTRKYLLEETKIISLENNISDFDKVNSGQIVIKVQKSKINDNHNVKIKDFYSKKYHKIKQMNWLLKDDEYKFRFNVSEYDKKIFSKINEKKIPNLKEQYPKKSLRTCTMLLNMEDKFVDFKINQNKNCNFYKYYQGSKALYGKYCPLFSNKYFFYDKKLRDEINSKLKEELIKKGVKNKKRIGLGDFFVYDNPKIFIRQSAKEIIASYDEKPSASNNSLYVFSLKKRDEKTKKYLKFLCGYLNSQLISFYAQKMEIIRYRKGKQPQIKISDLYSIPVPQNTYLINLISELVDKVYNNNQNKKYLEEKINDEIFNFYNFSNKEIKYIKESTLNFLKS